MCKIECNVYITNLGKYNEGELVGQWLSLPTSDDDIEECFENIGLNEEYEEYFITDYENNINLEISEYTNIYDLNEAIEQMKDSEDDAGLWGALIEVEGAKIKDIDELASNVNGGYYLFYEGLTVEEYEEQLVEECYDLNFDNLGNLAHYITIDYEALARDDYNAHETENGVLVYC